MAPVLLALFFCHAVSDCDVGVKFQFHTNGGLLNRQRFKAKTQSRYMLVCDLLFADDAALIATSFEEEQYLVHYFFLVCKAFGLNIRIPPPQGPLPA